MRRIALAAFAGLAVLVPAALPTAALASDTTFWSGPPNPGAIKQIRDLKRNGKTGAAARLQAMVNVPGSVWFTEGTSGEVRDYAAQTVAAARDDNAVPVLVAYNIPQRDCGSYSDGGALNGEAYKDWIDGIVEAIGDAQVVVIVEPDGLSGTPTDCGQTDRYGRLALIKYAALAFKSDANASVYIDAGNGDWNPPSVTAARLVEAGVGDIDGFALNVSNFQYTQNSNFYGAWVSQCIAYGTAVDVGAFDDCPDQWGGWGGHALSPYGKWSSTAAKQKFNVRQINERYAQLLGSTPPTAHWVVDTSRNGRGPWAGTSAHPASRGNTEAWCNPPDRGAGQRPTAHTGVALADAYLWIKIPGESDGECYRWTNGPKDPVRKVRDPFAGGWFRAQAREFADLAVPPFR
jgi:endoglucanase